MSNTKQSSKKQKSSVSSVEELIELIKQHTKITECMVLVEAFDASVETAVENGEEFYVEELPIGMGTFLVVGLGDLPTKFPAGITEV